MLLSALRRSDSPQRRAVKSILKNFTYQKTLIFLVLIPVKYSKLIFLLWGYLFSKVCKILAIFAFYEEVGQIFF